MYRRNCWCKNTLRFLTDESHFCLMQRLISLFSLYLCVYVTSHSLYDSMIKQHLILPGFFKIGVKILVSCQKQWNFMHFTIPCDWKKSSYHKSLAINKVFISSFQIRYCRRGRTRSTRWRFGYIQLCMQTCKWILCFQVIACCEFFIYMIFHWLSRPNQMIMGL